MSWGADGLLFGQASKGVMRVSADGGEPQILVQVEQDEIALRPQMLPGRAAVMFTLASINLLRPQKSLSGSWLGQGTRGRPTTRHERANNAH